MAAWSPPAVSEPATGAALPLGVPLNPNCRWRVEEDRAFLDWNYGCIAYVVPKDGRFLSVIQWQQRTHQAPCGSVAQGMRWIERWMAHRRGFPGEGKRRGVIRPSGVPNYPAQPGAVPATARTRRPPGTSPLGGR